MKNIFGNLLWITIKKFQIKKYHQVGKSNIYYKFRKEKKEALEAEHITNTTINNKLILKFDEVKTEEVNESQIEIEIEDKKEVEDLNDTTEEKFTFEHFEYLLHKSWLNRIANKEEIFEIHKGKKITKKAKNTDSAKKSTKEKVIKLEKATEKANKTKARKPKKEKVAQNDLMKQESSAIKDDLNQITISEDLDDTVKVEPMIIEKEEPVIIEKEEPILKDDEIHVKEVVNHDEVINI